MRFTTSEPLGQHIIVILSGMVGSTVPTYDYFALATDVIATIVLVISKHRNDVVTTLWRFHCNDKNLLILVLDVLWIPAYFLTHES